MTLRELVWMADARRETEGEYVAWLIACIHAAVWAPGELPRGESLNPFTAPKPMSEAMKRHLQAWEMRKWRAMAQG